MKLKYESVSFAMSLHNGLADKDGAVRPASNDMYARIGFLFIMHVIREQNKMLSSHSWHAQQIK